MDSDATTSPQHPGAYLRQVLADRGMIQADLAFVLGQLRGGLSLIMAEKRGVSPEMSKALGEALGLPPDHFAKLQTEYDLSRATDPDPAVGLRAAILNKYPVREMIRRGWIREEPGNDVQSELVRFFQLTSPDSIPYLSHAARKTRYEERGVSPAQLAWLFRVKQLAASVASQRYSEKALSSAVEDLRATLIAPEEARRVPRILMEAGVRFVIVETLPEAKIDGVCFWLNDASPVIGMSARYDRMDNFYFVLRHEIEHVLRGHGRKEEVVDAELDGAHPDTGDAIDEDERIANAAAAAFCVAPDKMDSFIKRKQPFFYEKDMLAFAQIQRVHPSLVVGQIQHRTGRYDYLRKYQVRIRHHVLPGAIADGWGQVIPL